MSIEHDRKRRRKERTDSIELSQRSESSQTSEHNSDQTRPGARHPESEGPQYSDHTANTKNPSQDEDWTSSSGSSSGDESETDIELSDSKVTTTSANPTPPNNDIHNRLTSFFSQLAEQRANPSLPDQSIEKGSSDSDSGFEDDDDGEGSGKQYVELDLALGVLSEQEDEELGNRGHDEIRLPLPSASNRELESDSDGDGDRGGLAELTNIAAGKSEVVNSSSNGKRRKHKAKVEELG